MNRFMCILFSFFIQISICNILELQVDWFNHRLIVYCRVANTLLTLLLLISKINFSQKVNKHQKSHVKTFDFQLHFRVVENILWIVPSLNDIFVIFSFFYLVISFEIICAIISSTNKYLLMKYENNNNNIASEWSSNKQIKA